VAPCTRKKSSRCKMKKILSYGKRAAAIHANRKEPRMRSCTSPSAQEFFSANLCTRARSVHKLGVFFKMSCSCDLSLYLGIAAQNVATSGPVPGTCTTKRNSKTHHVQDARYQVSDHTDWSRPRAANLVPLPKYNLQTRGFHQVFVHGHSFETS
jgi:hypothetical protein